MSRTERGRFATGAIVALLLAVFLVGAMSESTRSIKDFFNYDLLEFYESQAVVDLQGIVDDYKYQQESWMPIAPPDPDFTLWQDFGLLMFDPSQFPKTFVDGLVAVESGKTMIYPVFAYEDRQTRATVFLNIEGKKIGEVPAPAGYSPEWILLYMHPDFYEWNLSAGQQNYFRTLDDPARIRIRFDLITKNELLGYITRLSFAEEKLREEKKNKPGDGGIVIMMAYTGAPLTNVQITAIEYTNKIPIITIAYPWTSGDPTNSYTNKFEIFSCTNLVDFWWTSITTTNPSSTTNWIEWTDNDHSNFLHRFLRAGNADVDTDGDTLTDAREVLMYHSSPTNTDTDGDGLSDYQEAIVLNTDPGNPDTNKPAVTITFPTNNLSWIWMP